jgi:hypothetical protein
MAVAFRSDAEVTNGTAGTSVTVAKPSGIADTGSNPDRDHLIAVIAAAGAPSITPPADWVLVDTVASASALTMWVYRKLASSEGANWTWTLGSSLRNWGWVGAYTGVDVDDPIYADDEDNTLTGSLSLSVAETVHPAGLYIVAAAATRTASGVATTWTTEDFDLQTSNERADVSTNAGAGTDISGVVADVSWPQPYTNNAVSTATASQTQTAGVAELISLRPYFVPYGGNVDDTGTVVEFAFDVDPDTDSSDWSMTDVSAYVHHPAKLSIRHGRANRSSVADPCELRFTLLNLNGEWTSPTGTYAAKLVRNMPIKVRLNGFGVSVGGVGYHRGTFFLSSARPRWDTSTNFAIVDIVANGRLRRLQQPDEPLKSAAYAAIQRMDSNSGLATPVAHWPFEDESEATFAASAIAGVEPARTTNVVFAADSSVAGAAPLATVGPTSVITGTVPAYEGTGTWTVMFASNVPSEPAAAFGLLGWYTTGTAAAWQVALIPGSPSTLNIRAYNAAGTNLLDDAVSVDEATFYGQPQFHTITATQNGTGIDYVQLASGVGGNTGTLASATAGNVTGINLSPQAGTTAGTVLGHVAVHVQPGADGTFASSAVVTANATDDWPWARFNRLCNEANVPFVSQASESQDLTMGPQAIASFMQLVRECETVEGSVLNDSGASINTGLLWFPARDDRDNIDAQLTLDMSLKQVAPGFQPVLDDQDIVNDVEVSRVGGSSARVTDEASIAREGRYKEQVSVNTENDLYLADLAGWRVNLGTVPGMRFPSVSWNLRRSPELAEAWVNMSLFQRLDILHPPSQYPPDDIRTILEGYTETISSDTWTVTANLSPYDPNHVFVIADTSGDTDEWLGRLMGDDACALRTAIDDNDTAIVFDPNVTRFTTTADDFPLDLRLGGEVVTLSGIATTAATYVATGSVDNDDNAAVTPGLPAGVQAGDLLLILAAIRSSGTGTVNTPTGYTRMPVWDAGDNIQLFAKIHSGSESTPTVTFGGGSAGDTTSAKMMSFRGMPTTLTDLGDMVVDSLTQLNASAQNIAFPGVYPINLPGCVVLYLGWKQDDFSDVSTPGGFTETIDNSSTTGSDQGLVGGYQIQTTPAVAGSFTLTVTGGASAISRSAMVVLAAGYQTGTASARSVNGVVRSHAAGTRIAVDDAGVLGM